MGRNRPADTVIGPLIVGKVYSPYTFYNNYSIQRRFSVSLHDPNRPEDKPRWFKFIFSTKSMLKLKHGACVFVHTKKNATDFDRIVEPVESISPFESVKDGLFFL